MVKTTFLTCALFSVGTLAASPNDPVFKYRAVDSTLSVEGKTCSYGRASKSTLPEKISNEIKQFVHQNKNTFYEQIRSVKSGMAGRRLTHAELTVLYKLDISSANISYEYEGNDICGSYKIEQKLNFKQAYDHYLTSEPTDEYFILSQPNINVIHKIKQRYPALANVPPAKLKLFITKLFDVTDTVQLISFDYSSLKKQTATDKTKVFISGTDKFLPALQDTLTKFGFSVVDQIERSYWQISIKQTQYPHFEMEIDGQNKPTVTLSSRSIPLPPFPTSSREQQQKLLEFQLTMLKLREKLQ
jgi:hypothetical protein